MTASMLLILSAPALVLAVSAPRPTAPRTAPRWPRRSGGRGRSPSPSGAVRPAAGGVVVGAVAVLLAAAVLGPTPAVLLAGALVGGQLAHDRRARARRRGAVDRALPELVDLFVLAAAAGHPVHRCLHLVARRAPPSVRPALVAACARVDRGEPLAASLDRLGHDLGGLGTDLTDALVAGLETGAPLAPTLAGLADVARDQRRRRAEEAARRLPVTLLAPLVCCVLPAFALLAVVPLLAASLTSLGV